MVVPTDFSEYEDIVNSGMILEFSNEYSKETLEELQQIVKSKNLNGISCKGNTPDLSINSIESISKLLQNKIIHV